VVRSASSALSQANRPVHALADRTPAREWVRWQFRQSRATADSPTVTAGGQGVRSEKLARLEAALFVADGPLSTRKLSQFALLADTAEVRELIDELNLAYEQDGSAFSVERVASGYQLLTHPRYANWLDQLHQRTAELKLSSPAMETLTIIAYRQPITRAAIEAVRGVQCTEIIKVLMERNLIRIGGEEDTLGRPYLYVTTKTFLELFGLRTLDDLPDAKTLRMRPEEPSESEEEEPSESEEEEALSEDEEPTDDIAA